MTNKLHHRIPFVRRLYAERDNARAERDAFALTLLEKDQHQVELGAEVDRCKAERDSLLKKLNNPS
jgi:hypothetical protein